MEELFLDQQSLGLRPFLEGRSVIVRDITEILGHKDTRQGVADDKIIEFLLKNPRLILVTKDKGLGKRAKDHNLRVIFVDESEVVAKEVFRRLALGDYEH